MNQTFLSLKSMSFWILFVSLLISFYYYLSFEFLFVFSLLGLDCAFFLMNDKIAQKRKKIWNSVAFGTIFFFLLIGDHLGVGFQSYFIEFEHILASYHYPVYLFITGISLQNSLFDSLLVIIGIITVWKGIGQLYKNTHLKRTEHLLNLLQWN